MKTIVSIAIVVVVIAAGLAFFFARKNNATNSSTSTSSSSSQMSNMPANTNSSSNSTAQTTDKVTIANFAFSPASITVKKGTTVTWTNQDSATHTVTEMDGQDGPKSGDLSQGQTFTFTYNTAGTFKYHCSIHPNMTGTVTVTE